MRDGIARTDGGAAVRPGGREPLEAVTTITFDFGNTLVRVDRATLGAVVDEMAAAVVARSRLPDAGGFVRAWREEQARQFREEVPRLREVDLDQRLRRVLARARGLRPPPPDEAWDDVAASALSEPDEVGEGIAAYSAAFVRRVPPLPGAGELLRSLRGRGYRLGILSNWPSATTIDSFVEAAGWDELLEAVVVSQRIGSIKPGAEIFRAAEAALRASPDELLHVGDDWAQDVVGAKAAGWSAAYLPGRQGDSPLPTSSPDDAVRPDLVLTDLADLRLALPPSPPLARRAEWSSQE